MGGEFSLDASREPRAAPTYLEKWFGGIADMRLIVSANLSILLSNSAADGLLREGDVLVARAGTLAAASTEYQIAVSGLVAPSRDERPVLLGSSTQRQPVIVRVTPISPGEAYGLRLRRIGGLADEVLPDMARLYGLTRGETTLLRPIMRGESDKTIAAGLGLSVETVRSHLKNACAKMGLRGRSALAARIFELIY